MTNDSSSSDSSSTALELIAQRRFSDAVTLLQERIAANPTAEDHSQFALAFLQLEDYVAAARHYEAAAVLNPSNKTFREMLAVARANAVAEVNVRVPDPVFFERGKLLSPPEVPAGTLPKPIPPYGKSIVRKLRNSLGIFLGFFATIGVNLATKILGGILGYRDRVWTNWYKRPHLIGVLRFC
ncbi:MAG: hypothetical protein O2960_30740, partial [Verrucomicrobia bacterium]|nr:hypothetical protein [Verrucomicrobiota bacterium]